MRRYEREKPGTGGAHAAVNYHRNTGRMSPAWERFWWMGMLRAEMFRAQIGIDKPNAWCGGRNARLRRFIDRIRQLPCPKLP